MEVEIYINEVKKKPFAFSRAPWTSRSALLQFFTSLLSSASRAETIFAVCGDRDFIHLHVRPWLAILRSAACAICRAYPFASWEYVYVKLCPPRHAAIHVEKFRPLVEGRRVPQGATREQTQTNAITHAAHLDIIQFVLPHRELSAKSTHAYICNRRAHRPRPRCIHIDTDGAKLGTCKPENLFFTTTAAAARLPPVVLSHFKIAGLRRRKY